MAAAGRPSCLPLVSVRSECPQHAEARSRRPHSGNGEVSGGQAAVARPALHASVPVQTALLRLPLGDMNVTERSRQTGLLCVYYVKTGTSH